MLNTHEALLRNRDSLSGQVALLGLSDAAALASLPCDGGLVQTDHFGIYGGWSALSRWQPVFGYSSEALAESAFDCVVVFMPKSRPELEMRLALAQHLAKAGGTLMLIGEKKEGISGGAKIFKTTLPQAFKTDSARHCQVWEGAAPEGAQAFRLDDWQQWHTIEASGTTVDVAGLPGIFSDGRLDDGTALLLSTFDKLPVGPVLDFACGAGVIGAWLASQVPNLRVDAVDVQSQAVACAEATFARLDDGVEARAWASDGLSDVEGRYQLLVSNPPFHAGIRTDTTMTESFIRSAAQHLEKGGELRLVANRFLPYLDWIRRYVGPCEILAEDRRFNVYRAYRR